VPRIPDTANVIFGINPIRGPARTKSGRGGEADVTRLAALPVDLDIKPGACASLDVAHAIITELSIIMGTRPSVTVDSGHGLHAYWPVEDGAINEPFTTGQARALLRRWGRLVAVVAGNHQAHADSVFDLPRMLRVPGTFNKSVSNGAAPIPVVAYADTGGPLTLAEIDERLTEYGIHEEDEDRQDRERVSDPAGWAFAGSTCGYMQSFLDGLPGDGPTAGAGRHQWLLKQAVRLACGSRLGCLAESDYPRAGQLLGQRLIELRAATGEQVGRLEVGNALQFGVEVTAGKTDGEARAELGNHIHDGTGGPAEFEEPIPLAPDIVDVPPFPVDALPEVIANMVTELAEATQTDPAMAGTSALSVSAASVGGHAEIQIRRGWREPLCLSTNTIARPGERKSPVQAAMVKPIRDAEAEMSVAGELERLKLADELEMAKKTVDQLNKAAINAAAKAGPDPTPPTPTGGRPLRQRRPPGTRKRVCAGFRSR
jgi:hypothetical protein